MKLTYEERDRRARERLKAAHDACAPGNPKNKAWFARWEREFRSRWIEREGKFYPADSKVQP